METKSHSSNRGIHEGPAFNSPTHTDSVCGMKVLKENVKKNAKGASLYQDQSYYFCSTKCKSKFDKDPLIYLNKKNKPLNAVAKNVEYTTLKNEHKRKD